MCFRALYHIIKREYNFTKITYTGVQSALNLSCEYDAIGNVKTVKQNGDVVAQYEYDAQGQLVSETLPQQNLKYEYVYDTFFNLRQVKTYKNGSTTPTITEYGYTDADWADLMTSYNGQAITYDAIGNPLTYNNGTAWTFTWQGTHDLATATANGKSISYHYDMDGVRDSKTVNGVKHEYITQGGNVTLERWNGGETKSLEFIYDNGGAPYSVIYTHGSTSETYYYILNQQGDVIRIVDGNGQTAAEYVYNGWGEILSAKQATGTTIGELNPIRYRGYYYDSELNMYYLQSRYYDPVVKRMLSADDESLTASATLKDNNLFAYCDNDPIDRADDGAEMWHVIAGAIVGASISGATTMAGNLISGDRLTDGLARQLVVGAATGAAEAAGLGALGVVINVGNEAIDQVRYVQSRDKTIPRAVVDGAANIAFDATIARIDPTGGRSKKSIKDGFKKVAKDPIGTSKHVIKATRQTANKITSKMKKFSTKHIARKTKLLFKAVRISLKRKTISLVYNASMKAGKWFTQKLYWRYKKHR